MPYLVETSFDQFYDAINLGGDHRGTANGRRDDIVAKLGKSFDIIEFFSTGSIPKFTALKDHADLDVMVALHWSKHIKDKTPAQVIQLVRDALAQWRTGVDFSILWPKFQESMAIGARECRGQLLELGI